MSGKSIYLYILHHKPGRAILKHPEDVDSASFSSDGKRVITTSPKPPTIATINGKTVVSSSTQKSVRIWNLSSNLLLKLKDRVNSGSFSPDSKYILTASDDKTARIWDSTGKIKGLLG